MALSDLLASLRADLGDGDAALFDEATLKRCLHKSAYLVARDLDTTFPSLPTTLRQSLTNN